LTYSTDEKRSRSGWVGVQIPELFLSRTLVVGLGNPGLKYADTRHNFGFQVLDRFWRRRREGLGWVERLFRGRPKKMDALHSMVASFSMEKPGGETGENGQISVLCIWPMTYMNNSGAAVSAASRRFNIPTDEILVIHDDLDLPLGRLKVKQGGGAGGHKGLTSLMSELGGRGFARIRGGIGCPESGGDIVDYVLSPFPFEDRSLVNEMIETACDAIDVVLREGTVAAMNRFNGT
jgi:peptidyl-tRNA hydrolase, PTH1 family